MQDTSPKFQIFRSKIGSSDPCLPALESFKSFNHAASRDWFDRSAYAELVQDAAAGFRDQGLGVRDQPPVSCLLAPDSLRLAPYTLCR
jgi:hypothetical protein